MRKILILSLAFTLLLVACGKTEPPVTTGAPVTTAAPETTAPIETTVPETTEAPVTTESPVRIEQVAFEEADKIEKQAKDHFNGGDFDFKHSIAYTRVLSDKPGAVALNEKIKLLYAPMVEKLRNGQEGNELYRIGYNAAYTGKDYHTLMFHYTEFGGWQYSEGGTTQRFFYYDGINDRELTVDEYLASMDIDKEKALSSALWSYDLARAGYTADYNGEATDHGADVNYRLPGDSEILGATAENVLYFQRFTEFANSVQLDGAFVEPETVTLYFSGCMYTTDTFTVTLDRETLEPIRPNYEAVIALTAADTDRIEILFEDGKIISATAPAAFADIRITIKAHKVCIPYFAELNDALLSVNGGVPNCWSSAGDVFDFYCDSYTEYDKLESIVLHLSPKTAPPVETAFHYMRPAYSLYGGGEIGTQQITYPRVTTGTTAANAFNDKIAADYDPIIRELEKGDDYKIYNISYDFAYADGAMAITVDSHIGRQGTEGGSGRKMYYFDVTNDCELTIDEYAARMGVDMEKAKDGALWSYDLGSAGYGDGYYTYAETVGGVQTPLQENTMLFCKFDGFDQTVSVDGIGVTESEVILYLSGHAYISNIFSCTLDRDSLLPVRPNYYLRIIPAHTEKGDFCITFAGGKPDKITLPEDIFTVVITASSIHFEARAPYKADSFRLNGETWGLGYSARYNSETELYDYFFSPDPYVPAEALTSITIKAR